jgi:hypothetical protein
MEIEDEDDEGASDSGGGGRQSGIDLDRTEVDRVVNRTAIVGRQVGSG